MAALQSLSNHNCSVNTFAGGETNEGLLSRGIIINAFGFNAVDWPSSRLYDTWFR